MRAIGLTFQGTALKSSGLCRLRVGFLGNGVERPARPASLPSTATTIPSAGTTVSPACGRTILPAACKHAHRKDEPRHAKHLRPRSHAICLPMQANSPSQILCFDSTHKLTKATASRIVSPGAGNSAFVRSFSKGAFGDATFGLAPLNSLARVVALGCELEADLGSLGSRCLAAVALAHDHQCHGLVPIGTKRLHVPWVCHGTQFLVWQLGGVGLLVAVTLLCGWLQGVFGWTPAEINLEPVEEAGAGHEAGPSLMD